MVQIFEEVSLEVDLVPRSPFPVKAQFFLGVIAPSLLPFMLESKKRVTVYNPQRVIHQFGYNQGTVTLIGELSTSSALLAGMRFTGHGLSQIFYRRERLCWP